MLHHYQYWKAQPDLERKLTRIEQAIYTPLTQLQVQAWVTPEPVPYSARKTGKYAQLSIGESWGKLWDCAWMHFTGIVPESAAGRAVVLLIDISGEASIVDDEGSPVLGLTTVSSDFNLANGLPGKRVVPISSYAMPGEVIDLWADASCNDLLGKYQDSGTLKEAYIALYDEEMQGLYYDFEVLHDLLAQLPKEKARSTRILSALYRAVNELVEYTPDEVRRARAILARELAKTGGLPSLKLSAIGHAHIDLAWLWPIRETIRKGARSFSTVLALMERYPEYIFGASSPQLYQWMKDYYPQLYRKIKAKIAEDRWETQGAMWVEPDTNIPSGEALVRQILYGKRFFRTEFGNDPKMLWLPDVFGYSATLPQILKKAGVDYFLTIKLSWNNINLFPHHTFHWEGLDGSRILAHMPPEGTYNSSAAPRAIAAAETRYLDKAVSERAALIFGIGDGGGGPGPEHLERLAREKNLDGLAPVTLEHMETFFQHLAQEDNGQYKTWVGELYLERHQGTYTSQARIKRANRKIELALRELEFFAALAHQVAGYGYPVQELDAIWKEILLYQFHDILPGTAITRVYDESQVRYQQLFEQVESLLETALQPLMHPNSLGAITVFNALSWERTEWLKIKEYWHAVTVPALGYTTLHPTTDTQTILTLNASTEQLENDMLCIQFTSDGAIHSIYDKRHRREVIEPGTRGNKLAVYADEGDAWDIPMHYDERPPHYFKLREAHAYIDGPCAIIEQHYSFGQSTLDQRIILRAGSQRIDFETSVDWHEQNKMLRTSFPITITAQEVTCDIQFAMLKRLTHRNTSWDMARFEICAHKWIDLSQNDYGVALLNDCKYGHKVLDNVLDLNLLRSPSYPDPQADQGRHQFTYALYPHAGNAISGNVVHAGYELNVPLRVIEGSFYHDLIAPDVAFVQVDAANVIIETVKKAEESDDLILRLYEATGATTQAILTFNFAPRAIWKTNLLEEGKEPLSLNRNAIELTMQPFEILTLRVQST